MRITVASRIFDPEPSAAAFRLRALAQAAAHAGHQVTVLTVRAPRRLKDGAASQPGYRVRRFPVLRDRSGYVRGYLPYLSFDLPLFFRILFGRSAEVIVVEPPPTTGLAVRAAAFLRRTPYVYYAADVWSHAVKQTSASALVARLLRRVERYAINGARVVLAVSPGVQHSLAELRVHAPVVMVGNGIDVTAFSAAGPRYSHEVPNFVYGGTASELHGAEVFVRALALVQRTHPEARLYFIGGGSQKQQLTELARDIGVNGVSCLALLPPEELARWLRGATAALGSVRPGRGYDFAFPTKLYAAVAAGAPVIYAGIGPAVDFVRTRVAGQAIGHSCRYSAEEVAQAMLRVIESPVSAQRREAVSAWGRQQVDITRIAERIRQHLERVITPPKG